MINTEVEDFIEELFKSPLNRYQNNLEKLMNGIKFVFDYVYLLYYKCHKINPYCGVSHDDWKKNEKNNLTIALNVLVVKKEKIYCAYVSKLNSNHEKQVISLMILNGEGWHYLAVKKLSGLLRRITSKNYCDFYFLDCLHSFAIKNKRESQKNVYENKDFCNIVMPSENTKIY